MSHLHIGTSGWSYNHWEGPFYPEGLAAGKRLAHYAGRFSSVEINTSFYHLPAAATVDQWRDTVPAGFVFSAKASRYITHMKKLRDPHKTVPPFLQPVDRLGDPSWFDRSVRRLLEKHDAAFCIYDLGGQVSPKYVTTDFVYVRLHGPAAAYQGSYDNRALAGWAGAFSTWVRQGRAVYCYFDNDQQGHAVLDALRLKHMLEKS
jgi:uncharacterized protein YecE (DUF72 family)